MQFHLKARLRGGGGDGGELSPNTIHFNQTIFNWAVWCFPLLRHCTYRSKLSLKFNTQRVPWNLNKSTGKQLTSFWWGRWWEGAQGWREAWKLWPQAKKVGSHKPYSQHLVGECDSMPRGWGAGVFQDFAPACSPAGSCCWRWVWAPITVPESSIFFSWQQVQELEAERWAGLSRPVCELKRPPHIPQTLLRVSLRVSSTSENKHFLLRGRDDGLMGAGRQGRRRQVVWDGVFRLLLEAACFWRPSHVRTRGELSQMRQCHHPRSGRWGLEMQPQVCAVNKHPHPSGKPRQEEGHRCISLWDSLDRIALR